MKTEMIKVSPRTAEHWLKESNVDNRRMRGWWVDALAQEMRLGRFVQNHQGIAFSKSGRLIDGQHRLAAIVKSGCTVNLLVSSGVDEEAFMVVDCGIKRNMSDLTALNKRTAEVSKLLVKYAFYGTAALSSHLVLEVANCGFGELSDKLVDYCPTQRKVFSSTPIRTMAVVMIADGHDEDYVMGLYRDMVLLHLDQLPPVASAFVKQVMAGKIHSNMDIPQLFARARKVFDPAMAEATRLLVSDADGEAAVQYIKATVRGRVSGE